MRPLAAAFVESVIEAFVDAGCSLGRGAGAPPIAVEVPDPAIFADVVVEEPSVDVLVEESAA